MLKKVKRIKLGIRAYRRIMKRVLERDDWRCQKCGSLEDPHIHPQTKRSQHGDDAHRNLVTLCAHCHMEEHRQLFYSGAHWGLGIGQSEQLAVQSGPFRRPWATGAGS